RRRIVRQLLTESVVLAALAGALGLLVALWGTSALGTLFPTKVGSLSIPRIEHIPIDSRVIGFALFVSLAAALLFGLAPALAASRRDLEQSLRESGGGATVRGSRGRRLLSAAEIALAVVLATAAGLLARSFERLVHADLGFTPSGLLTARAILPES